jgi:hypothetical protein
MCGKLSRTQTIQGVYRIINNNNCKFNVNGTVIRNYFKINDVKRNFVTQ